MTRSALLCFAAALLTGGMSNGVWAQGLSGHGGFSMHGGFSGHGGGFHGHRNFDDHFDHFHHFDHFDHFHHFDHFDHFDHFHHFDHFDHFHHFHHFHDHFFFGAFIGEPFFWGPYPYYSYPPAVYVQEPPPVYVQQSGDWYYCPTSKAYFPYVPSCDVPWQRVAPQPPQQGGY